MKTFNLSFISVLLLFILSCQNTTDSNINEKIQKVSVNSSEVFEYQTGISGDEEEATITQQPEHYEISEIMRDSTTEWEAVYRYKAESGFEGTDQVEIKLATGSDGASANTHIELIKIEITVH